LLILCANSITIFILQYKKNFVNTFFQKSTDFMEKIPKNVWQMA